MELTDPRWHELKDAYGMASGIPKLLQQLSVDTGLHKGVTDEPWFTLWSSLCHQGDVYTASYAAVPYIVGMVRNHNEKKGIDFSFFLLPASIEIARVRGRGPDLPRDLEADYRASIKEQGDLAMKYKNVEDPYLKRAAQGAYLVANGQIDEAEKLLDEDE